MGIDGEMALASHRTNRTYGQRYISYTIIYTVQVFNPWVCCSMRFFILQLNFPCNPHFVMQQYIKIYSHWLYWSQAAVELGSQ